MQALLRIFKSVWAEYMSLFQYHAFYDYCLQHSLNLGKSDSSQYMEFIKKEIKGYMTLGFSSSLRLHLRGKANDFILVLKFSWTCTTWISVISVLFNSLWGSGEVGNVLGIYQTVFKGICGARIKHKPPARKTHDQSAEFSSLLLFFI